MLMFGIVHNLSIFSKSYDLDITVFAEMHSSYCSCNCISRDFMPFLFSLCADGQAREEQQQDLTLEEKLHLIDQKVLERQREKANKWLSLDRWPFRVCRRCLIMCGVYVHVNICRR
jgi:hypothetical protein